MAFNGKFISAKTIIANVYMDLDIQEEERFWDMFEWCFKALAFIGVPEQNIKKACPIEIEDYKAALPIDYDYLIQIEYNGFPLKPSTGNFGVETLFGDLDPEVDVPPQIDNGLTVPATKQFQQYYEFVPGYIKTSFRCGTINMAYYALPVDCDGFPLVPDLPSYSEAIFWFIFSKLLLGGYKHPSINYDYAHNKWQWYCGQARAEIRMPDVDLMEIQKVQRLSLVPNVNSYNTFFEDLGQYKKFR